MRSNKSLKKWYRYINKRYFLDELPNDVCVRYVNQDDIDEEEKCEERYKGWAEKSKDTYHQYLIVIVPNGRLSDIATLAHEMVHISTSLRDDHGDAFEARRQMISDRGIFKKGAIYKGLTLF